MNERCNFKGKKIVGFTCVPVTYGDDFRLSREFKIYKKNFYHARCIINKKKKNRTANY